MVQIAYPLAYTFYIAFGYRSLGILQFLAPYITLGIGLDDIFMFTSTYKSVIRHSEDYSVATRLQLTYNRAAKSMLATSATSAAAFASNVISPVPAVAVFGLLLALIVAVNFILAVTWTPICVVIWDRYLLNRNTKTLQIVPCEQEKRSAEQSAFPLPHVRWNVWMRPYSNKVVL